MPRPALALIPIALAAFLLYFEGLDRVGLLSVDEPRYAAIGRAMAETGDWVTPRLWGEAWFEKPALLFWLVGGATRLGLKGEWAARLPVALVSAAFLIFYYRRLRVLFSTRAAAYSTVILATGAGWLAYSHLAVTDLPMAAAFSAAMLLALPWAVEGERQGLVAAGILLGIAILGKALVPVALALPVLWFARRRLAGLLLPIAGALAVALPWYWLCWRANGAAFVDELFVRHHLARAAGAETLHPQPIWFYVPVLAGWLFPWTFVAATLWRNPMWSDGRVRYLAAWFGFGFVLLSASSGKLPGYIVPLLPAAAALIGIALDRAARARTLATVPALTLAAFPLALALLPAAVDRGLGRAVWTWDSRLLLFLAAAVAGATFAAAIYSKYGKEAAFWIAACFAAIGFAAAKPLLFAELEARASGRPLAAAITRTGVAVCAEGLRRSWEYQVSYYLARPLPDCEQSQEPFRITIDPDTGRPRIERRTPAAPK